MNSAHPLHKKINLFAAKHVLVPHGSKIILGLSGGPDSLFLLHYLAPLHHAGAIHLTAAHLDHGWRAQSADDAEFCEMAAAALGITCKVGKLSELNMTVKFNGSKEEVGRIMRRHFFEQLQKNHFANFIALAHHADDQQETFFIRLFRGATLTGLTGMKPRHGIYIRPLLSLSKTEILSYLHDNGIAYLTDQTNDSPEFLRNRIRSAIIPALKKTDARFESTLSTTMERLAETEQFLEIHTEHIWNTIASGTSGIIEIHIPSLRSLHKIMQQRVVLKWLIAQHVPFPASQGFFNEILRFLNNVEGKKHCVHAAWSIQKKGDKAWIKKN